MELTKKKTLGIAPSPAVVSENFQKAAQDLHAALEKPTPVATEADSKAAEFKSKKLVCSRGPTIEFKGKLLGEYSTDPQGKKTKWTELRLWETPSGKWVAESAGCSDEPGHVDIIDAHVIRGPVVLVDRQTLKEFEEKTPQTLSMEFQAMEFWGWSSPAKALAKKLGWNLSVVVD